jgi:hypothetical protein
VYTTFEQRLASRAPLASIATAPWIPLASLFLPLEKLLLSHGRLLPFRTRRSVLTTFGQGPASMARLASTTTQSPQASPTPPA